MKRQPVPLLKLTWCLRRECWKAQWWRSSIGLVEKCRPAEQSKWERGFGVWRKWCCRGQRRIGFKVAYLPSFSLFFKLITTFHNHQSALQSKILPGQLTFIGCSTLTLPSISLKGPTSINLSNDFLLPVIWKKPVNNSSLPENTAFIRINTICIKPAKTARILYSKFSFINVSLGRASNNTNTLRIKMVWEGPVCGRATSEPPSLELRTPLLLYRTIALSPRKSLPLCSKNVSRSTWCPLSRGWQSCDRLSKTTGHPCL